MRHKLWFLPAFIVTLGILLLSTVLAFPVQVEGVDYMDKITHIFAYMVLTFSYLLAFKMTELLTASAIRLLMLGCSIYGMLLELAQYTLFPDRYFEWVDALANVLGVLVGYGLFKLQFRG